LADIISSGAVSVVRLTEVFRQAAKSQIIVSAHRINDGVIPDLRKPEADSDFYFVEASPKLPPVQHTWKRITDSDDSVNSGSSTYMCAIFCHDSQCDSSLNYNIFFLPVAAKDSQAQIWRNRLTRLTYSAFCPEILGQLRASDPETTVGRIIELVKTRIPRRFGLDPIRDVQVLCPMNRGGVGARSLNIELQKAAGTRRRLGPP
jgi:hypothetical protein